MNSAVPIKMYSNAVICVGIIVLLFIIGCAEHETNEDMSIDSNQEIIIFEDTLSGSGNGSWVSAPIQFDSIDSDNAVYILPSDENGYPVSPASVGDQSWETYRIEVEFLNTGGGWTGIDFHVQENGEQACNVSIYCEPEQEPVPLEMAAWRQERLVWKLYPYSQRTVDVVPNQWYTLRIEVAKTFANVYFNDSAEPCYTIYDLPFKRGGIRFSTYYSESAFRNFKVTKLPADHMTPLLLDAWERARIGDVISNWELTEPVSLEEGERLWQEKRIHGFSGNNSPVIDLRGVVDLSAIFSEWHEEGVVIAQSIITSDVSQTDTLYVTYTDRFKLRVNGEDVFEGPPREWFHPERAEHGYSRLIPDQYAIPVQWQVGDNHIDVYSEQREPLFGWGFWMRKK